eukprot:1145143-Pelagomonas_calceolata.AAC.5
MEREPRGRNTVLVVPDEMEEGMPSLFKWSKSQRTGLPCCASRAALHSGLLWGDNCGTSTKSAR